MLRLVAHGKAHVEGPPQHGYGEHGELPPHTWKREGHVHVTGDEDVRGTVPAKRDGPPQDTPALARIATEAQQPRREADRDEGRQDLSRTDRPRRRGRQA